MVQPEKSASTLARGAAHISKRIITSYVVDWIFILATAGVGAAFNKIDRSNHRPFSLQDPSISYPNHPDTVTLTTLVLVSVLAPGIITFVVSFLFIPGPTVEKSTPKALIWRRKLWEWNTAWMGLGLSLATAFMLTEGLKDLAGKPRPHAIAVCRPDLSAISQYRVGGLGNAFDTTGATPIMVDYHICQETDPAVLRDAFASWPSGHSSFSCAGLIYLSLFLCSKFAVSPPYLNITTKKQLDRNTFEEPHPTKSHRRHANHVARNSTSSSDETPKMIQPGRHVIYPPRNQAAAPPVYLIILAIYVPVSTALFICVSRWFDFHHHGIDIFTGATIGTISAYLSFRFYHMPVRRGAGWSWGARSRSRAFWLGVGREGYVGDEGWEAEKVAMQKSQSDLESGLHGERPIEHQITGPGVEDRAEEQRPGPGRSRQSADKVSEHMVQAERYSTPPPEPQAR